jgi:integrase
MGPLFRDVPPGPDRNRGNAAGKRIIRMVREKVGITDPRKAPSHSFRHLFKDLCRDAEIEKAVHDALTGHATTDVGDKYGKGFSLSRLHREINKIPPFRVDGPHAENEGNRDAA